MFIYQFLSWPVENLCYVLWYLLVEKTISNLTKDDIFGTTSLTPFLFLSFAPFENFQVPMTATIQLLSFSIISICPNTATIPVRVIEANLFHKYVYSHLDKNPVESR